LKIFTKRTAAAARLDGDGGAPVVGGEGGRAAEVPLTTAHLTAAAASGGDGSSGAAEDGRRRRRTKCAWRRLYRARETTEEGANERGRRGGPIYSIGLKRSNSSRKKSIRENLNSVFRDKFETNSIRIKSSTIRSKYWG
jgi:hypothetical protein